MEGDDKLPVRVRKLVLELAPIAQSRDPATCWYALAFLLGKAINASDLNPLQKSQVVDTSYGVIKGASDGRYRPPNSVLKIARERPQKRSHEMMTDILIVIGDAVDTEEAMITLATALGSIVGSNFPRDKRQGPLQACLDLIQAKMHEMDGPDQGDEK